MRTLFILGMILCIGFIGMNCQIKPGVKVVQLPVPEDPTISFRIWFKVGSQNDPTGKAGLANLTARMLTEASTNVNSYEVVLDKLYPMAASIGSQVDKEMTIILGRTHRDNLKEFYNLLHEAIFEPAFKQEDLRRLKSEILNNLKRSLRYSNDEELGKEALYQFIFQKSNYEAPVMGLIESVESITVEDIQAFYKKNYTKDNVIIGIGGGYPLELVGEMKDDFEKLPAGAPVAPDLPAIEPIQGLQVLLVEKETESTAISMGFPINVLRGSRDYYALWLVNSWFGEHRNSSSHLYQVIREDRGLNYGDYSYIEHFPQGGYRQFPPPNVARRQQLFEIWIRPVQNQVRHFTLRAAIRELLHLVEKGLTTDQFELTKKFLKNYWLNYAPTTDFRLGYYLDDIFYGVATHHLEQFQAEIESLTLEEVNQAIKRHLQFQNMKIAMVTKDAAGFKDDFVQNRISPIEYRSPKPDAVTKEDKIISTYKLKISPENVHIRNVEEMFNKKFE
ncbi:insulinase family protein [candidate division KSB1 bacterium]|nr:insulinase family protein [candidate division KSB1 bacterium]